MRQYSSEQNLHGQLAGGGAVVGGAMSRSASGGMGTGQQRPAPLRSSWHDQQIPSTVQEVPQAEILDPNRQNWSQTMPRLQNSASWKTQSIPENLRGRAQEGVVNSQPPHLHYQQQQGVVGVAVGGVASQRLNGYHQRPVSHSGTRPHAMSAHNIASHNRGPPTQLVGGKLPHSPRRTVMMVKQLGMSSNANSANQQHIPRHAGPSSFHPATPIQVPTPQVPADRHDLLNPGRPQQQQLSDVDLYTNPRKRHAHLNPTSSSAQTTPIQVPEPHVPASATPLDQPRGANHHHHAQQQQQGGVAHVGVADRHHEPHYTRGHVMTVTTAPQHVTADTHVSPSHSHSKVTPVPVHHLGNGHVVVQQGFEAVPAQSYYGNGTVVANQVPIPVQAPLVPPTLTTITSRAHGQADIPKVGVANTEPHPPSSSSSAGQMTGAVPHYKAVTDSPNLRLHPSHATAPSFDGNDSLASHSSVSMDAEMSAYTEQMSKALEQFDTLLTKKPSTSSIIQTSF